MGRRIIGGPDEAAPIRHTTTIPKRRRRGAILFISDGLKSHGY
jgi:hypothetical protein